MSKKRSIIPKVARSFFVLWLGSMIIFFLGAFMLRNSEFYSPSQRTFFLVVFVVGVVTFLLMTIFTVWGVIVSKEERKVGYAGTKKLISRKIFGIKYFIPGILLVLLVIVALLTNQLMRDPSVNDNTFISTKHVKVDPTPVLRPTQSPEELKSLLYEKVNSERVKNGASKLSVSSLLERSAYLKAVDMLEKGYWEHESPDGKQPWSFVLEVDYDYVFAGENLAKDIYYASTAVNSWMNSPEHKKNILDRNFTETGISVVSGKLNGADTLLIVQHFGTPTGTFTQQADGTSRTGKIIKYNEWCTGEEISIYENELITKKSSDGNIYTMTQGDWECYEESFK